MNISFVSNLAPTIRLCTPKQSINNLSKIALPVIAIVGMTLIQEAKAVDPYVECFENCEKFPDAHPLAVLICQTACFVASLLRNR